MPNSRTLPPTTFAFEGRRRRSDRAVVVLPHPDSPAIPRASPSSRRNETPSTAFTTPDSRVKYVRRSSTTSSGASGSAPLGRSGWRRCAGDDGGGAPGGPGVVGGPGGDMADGGPLTSDPSAWG